MRKRFIGLAALALAAAPFAAPAQEKKLTVAVSIPAADHGWTGGVVYHANRVKAALEASHPGLKIRDGSCLYFGARREARSYLSFSFFSPSFFSPSFFSF